MIVDDLVDHNEVIKTSPTSGGEPVVHLSERCPHVGKADRKVRKPIAVVFDDRRVCDWCADDAYGDG